MCQLFKLCISSNYLFSATLWSPLEPQTNNRVATLQKRKVKFSSAAEDPIMLGVVEMLLVIHLFLSFLSLCKEGEARGEGRCWAVH